MTPGAEFSHEAGNRRVHVVVRGIVQGVGFRPFIFQLASRHGLDGWVRNKPDGVEIEVCGPKDNVGEFLRDLPDHAPPLARIVSVAVTELPFAPMGPFAIVKSDADEVRSTLIAPDTCTCRDCRRELFDPNDRRFRYPFINCTNCGPRYTIIKDIPYDRDKTTMARFAMCPSCRKEYEDPMDRRFHAQPNACWECGPQVWLETPDGRTVARRDEAVREAVKVLEDGAILAVKGLGGFHLAVLATSEPAVNRLRSRKIREEKPFAVMFSDPTAVKRVCELAEEEEALLTGIERPIVLLKQRPGVRENPVAASVAPRNRYLGAFLPYAPLHFLLFDGASYDALVLTSGNQSDEPIVMDNEEARGRLEGIADYFLLHDRDIFMRCDDSVVRVLDGKPRPMRRARGYVPVPVFLKEPMAPVLGVGAELKNTVCLIRGGEAFLSQHIGDLENLETLHSFEHAIRHLERILEVRPECIAHDMHPDYLNTQWALERNDLPLIAVQHHHAHIASVVAERRLSGPVLGLALDGTGYGEDGTIWGGELLLVEEDRFERLGHFRQVPLPGGNRAIKEPWRMALSYLWSMDPENVSSTFGDILDRWPGDHVRIVRQMLDRGLNAPLTSSCGRLFDAVSALAGLRNSVNYEGQAAIEFEQVLEPAEGAYKGLLEKQGAMWVLDPFPMIGEVVRDVRGGVNPGTISARFHNGLVSLLVDAVEKAGKESGLDRIALSGGVFQNAYLVSRLEEALARKGFTVFSHVEVPPNDACISLGQAAIGAWRLAHGGI